jgi:hypothetical protein
MSFRIHLSLPLASAFEYLKTDARDVTDKLDELVAKRPSDTPPPSRENVAERFRRLENCDLVVAPLLAPCFQVGVEIERAFARGIPILFIAWGRPSYGGIHPQLSGFPPHKEYALGVEPLMIGEEWAFGLEHELERRLNDPAVLKAVNAAAEKRKPRRLSTDGLSEL